MTESQAEGQKKILHRRRIGKIVLALGLFVIVVVILLGMLTSLVSAYGGSTELVRVYDAIAGPSLVLGILLVMGGLLAILLPEGLSQDGIWKMRS